MKETMIAVYKRESTLWKNANGFYHAQDWVTMECKVFDYTEEINSIISFKIRWFDSNGADVTESEIERRYGKPYCVNLVNYRKTNEKSFYFKTKEDANKFVSSILKDKILGNFKRIS